MTATAFDTLAAAARKTLATKAVFKADLAALEARLANRLLGAALAEGLTVETARERRLWRQAYRKAPQGAVETEIHPRPILPAALA